MNTDKDIRRLSEIRRFYSVFSCAQAYSVKNQCAKDIFGDQFRLGFHR
jgi:hypothetical protein